MDVLSVVWLSVAQPASRKSAGSSGRSPFLRPFFLAASMSRWAMQNIAYRMRSCERQSRLPHALAHLTETG